MMSSPVADRPRPSQLKTLTASLSALALASVLSLAIVEQRDEALDGGGARVQTGQGVHDRQASSSTQELVEQVSPDQDSFNLAVDKIREFDPANYSDARWAGSLAASHVSFVQEPSIASRNVLASLTPQPKVVVGAPLSRAVMDDLTFEVAEVLAKDPSVISYVVAMDAEHQVMAVEMEADPLVGRIDSGISTMGGDEMPLPALPSGFTYEVAVKSEGPEATLSRGGVSFGECTSGFAVRQGGSNGLLTAGHCTNYAKTPTGTNIPAQYREEHRGRYGDMQWRSTPDSISRFIRISPSQTRSISSYGNLTRGSQVCNNGRTRSSSSCGVVLNESVCVQYPNQPNMCSLVSVRGSFTNPGDSGGPWYVNNRAVGIHSGVNSSKNEMYYSRVDRALSILRLNLFTG